MVIMSERALQMTSAFQEFANVFLRELYSLVRQSRTMPGTVIPGGETAASLSEGPSLDGHSQKSIKAHVGESLVIPFDLRYKALYALGISLICTSVSAAQPKAWAWYSSANSLHRSRSSRILTSRSRSPRLSGWLHGSLHRQRSDRRVPFLCLVHRQLGPSLRMDTWARRLQSRSAHRSARPRSSSLCSERRHSQVPHDDHDQRAVSLLRMSKVLMTRWTGRAKRLKCRPLRERGFGLGLRSRRARVAAFIQEIQSLHLNASSLLRHQLDWKTCSVQLSTWAQMQASTDDIPPKCHRSLGASYKSSQRHCGGSSLLSSLSL
jgi:hypothetical protein